MIKRKVIGLLAVFLMAVAGVMPLSSPVSHAAGVPLFSYNQGASFNGGVSVFDVTGWGQLEGAYDYADDSSHTLYTVVGSSPMLWDSSQAYSGNLTIDLSGGYRSYSGSISNRNATFIVQGYDGSNWTTIYTLNSFGPSNHIDWNLGSAMYKQIRFLLAVGGTPWNTWWKWPIPKTNLSWVVWASYNPDTTAVSGTATLQVYRVAADQATAQQAATAAQQARDAANNTVQYAQQARDAANNVNTIVNDTLTVNAGVVQDNQGTVLQAARDANKKLDNLNQTVTNISQSIPPVMNGIHGLNGATATSSGALQVVIDSSGATQYSYRIDNGGWSPWMPIQDIVSVPVPKGVHTLTIQVANGPVGTPGPAAKSSMQVIGL